MHSWNLENSKRNYVELLELFQTWKLNWLKFPQKKRNNLSGIFLIILAAAYCLSSYHPKYPMYEIFPSIAYEPSKKSE